MRCDGYAPSTVAGLLSASWIFLGLDRLPRLSGAPSSLRVYQASDNRLIGAPAARGCRSTSHHGVLDHRQAAVGAPGRRQTVDPHRNGQDGPHGPVRSPVNSPSTVACLPRTWLPHMRPCGALALILRISAAMPEISFPSTTLPPLSYWSSSLWILMAYPALAEILLLRTTLAWPRRSTLL